MQAISCSDSHYHRLQTAVSFADNEYSSAYAYTDCYARIIAETWAYAAAKAAADAGCYYNAGDANAAAAVLAKVKTVTKQWRKCTIVSDADGTGDANAGGDAFADYVRPAVLGCSCRRPLTPFPAGMHALAS